MASTSHIDLFPQSHRTINIAIFGTGKHDSTVQIRKLILGKNFIDSNPRSGVQFFTENFDFRGQSVICNCYSVDIRRPRFGSVSTKILHNLFTDYFQNMDAFVFVVDFTKNLRKNLEKARFYIEALNMCHYCCPKILVRVSFSSKCEFDEQMYEVKSKYGFDKIMSVPIAQNFDAVTLLNYVYEIVEERKREVSVQFRNIPTLKFSPEGKELANQKLLSNHGFSTIAEDENSPH